MPRDTQRDPEREAELINEAVAEVRRGLIFAGLDGKTADVLINRYRSHFGTEQKGAGPQLRVKTLDGAGHLTRHNLVPFIEALAEVAHIEALGPDPAHLVRDRLIEIGLTREEAEPLTERRVWRTIDGRIAFRVSAGPLRYSGEEEEGDALFDPQDRFIGFVTQQLYLEHTGGVRPGERPRRGADPELMAEKVVDAGYSL